MNKKAKIEKNDNITKVKTFPPWVSSIVKNRELTTKLLIQLVAVAKATAVSIKCIGYISELTVHGVEENPIEKKARYKQIEGINMNYPVSYWRLVKNILIAINIKDTKIPGKTLIIIYLLPNLSIKNIAIVDPTALVKAKGIFNIMPSLFLSVTP